VTQSLWALFLQWAVTGVRVNEGPCVRLFLPPILGLWLGAHNKTQINKRKAFKFKFYLLKEHS
jgi:hypothetical protein